jgi:hypothetical protein
MNIKGIGACLFGGFVLEKGWIRDFTDCGIITWRERFGRLWFRRVNLRFDEWYSFGLPFGPRVGRNLGTQVDRLGRSCCRDRIQTRLDSTAFGGRLGTAAFGGRLGTRFAATGGLFGAALLKINESKQTNNKMRIKEMSPQKQYTTLHYTTLQYSTVVASSPQVPSTTYPSKKSHNAFFRLGRTCCR